MRPFKVVYYVCIAILINLAMYNKYTNATTGGIIYGKYGGATSVSYGANGLFIMIGIILSVQFIGWFFDLGPKKPAKTAPKKKRSKIKPKHNDSEANDPMTRQA